MADIKVSINLNSLPSEYQMVEYIQSDGSAYIDTGFKPKSFDKIIIEAVANSTNQRAFGCNDSSMSIGVIASNGQGYSGTYMWGNSSFQKSRLDGIFGFDKNNCISEDSVVKTFSYSNFNIDKSLFLFANNNNGTAESVSSNLQIKRFEVVENNVIILKLISAYRISDNAIGFYDLISGNFYTNNGTGSFTKGADSDDNSRLKVEFGKQFIKGVESLHQLTSDASDIKSGVLPNSGSVELLDRNKYIMNMVKTGIFKNSGLSLKIYVNGKQLQEHTITDSDYNYEKNTFVFNLSNVIQKYEERNKINTTVVNNKNLYSLISSVFQDEFNIDVDFSSLVYDFDNKSIDLEDFLGKIKFLYLTCNISYRKYIDSLLSLCGLYLTITDEGEFKLLSNRPLINADEQVISIPSNMCRSRLKQDVFVANVYNDVTTNIKTITKSKQNAYNRDFTIYEVEDGQESIVAYNIDENAIVETSVSTGNKVIGFFLTISSSNPIYNFNVLSVAKMSNFVVSGVLGSGDSVNKEIDITGSSVAYLSNTKMDDINLSTLAQNYSNFITTVYILGGEETENGHTFAILAPLLDYSEGIDPQTYQPIPRSTPFRPRVLKVALNTDTYHVSNKDARITENGEAFALESQTFLSDKCTYTDSSENDVDLFTKLGETIVEDYSNGIKTATIPVACGNLYFENGNIAKTWSIGEVLEVGDIVKIYSSDDYWRVVGRNFKYVGKPSIELELQETKWNTALTDMFRLYGIDANGIEEGESGYDGNPVEYIIGTGMTVNNGLNGDYLNTDVTQIYQTDSSVPDVGIDELVIPDTYKGLPVTKINTNAISDARPGSTNDGGTISRRISKIVLGANVEVLEYSAFNKASSVNQFVFNDKLKELSNHCLYKVFSNSSEIVLPSTVNKIGMQVFTSDSTYRLKEIKITGSFESPENGVGAGGYSQGYYICDNALTTVFASTVRDIDGRILNNSGDKLVFLHGQDDYVHLNIVAPKSAVTVDIYTDNPEVRTYNWSLKNITPTFHTLSEYVES